jgi:hypothetical protein
MSTGPYIAVKDFRVERHPTLDVVLAVFVHQGQIFHLYFEAGDARRLAGELAAAYQEATKHEAPSTRNELP